MHARVFEIHDFIGQMLSHDAIALGPERASNVKNTIDAVVQLCDLLCHYVNWGVHLGFI